ncbi:hypothetical protein ACSBR1_013576 [Camellia fascicularis]
MCMKTGYAWGPRSMDSSMDSGIHGCKKFLQRNSAFGKMMETCPFPTNQKITIQLPNQEIPTLQAFAVVILIPSG